uniref:F-box domain-containing protein n=1 Tax=Aegilops tauschii TaxID=37682 RepID=R7W2G1_AEGTA
METTLASGEDRLKALPNDLLIYLMSFLPSRDFVRTCVLGKRWSTLWKSVPALRIDDPDSYDAVSGSNTFVNEFLRLRDPTPLNVCDISSDCVETTADYPEWADEAFQQMKPWLWYALSCQVQVLKICFPWRVIDTTLISSHLKRLAPLWGWAPLLDSMPSLVTTSVKLGEGCEEELCYCSNPSCEGCDAQPGGTNYPVALQSLSGATNLKLKIYDPTRHSPILETLKLQLDLESSEDYHLSKTDESCNLKEQSLLSPHLKVVKIICCTPEDVIVRRILKILCAHGVPYEKIEVEVRMCGWNPTVTLAKQLELQHVLGSYMQQNAHVSNAQE